VRRASQQQYCLFGNAIDVLELDSFRLCKLARESGVIGTFVGSTGDVDVLFAKVCAHVREVVMGHILAGSMRCM
jgi:hypothetical protein